MDTSAGRERHCSLGRGVVRKAFIYVIRDSCA